MIDKIADANSTICSWRTTGNSLRNTFGRQAIPMVWTYAEGNPFSKITGNLSSTLKSVVNAILMDTVSVICNQLYWIYMTNALSVSEYWKEEVCV